MSSVLRTDAQSRVPADVQLAKNRLDVNLAPERLSPLGLRGFPNGHQRTVDAGAVEQDLAVADTLRDCRLLHLYLVRVSHTARKTFSFTAGFADGL